MFQDILIVSSWNADWKIVFLLEFHVPVQSMHYITTLLATMDKWFLWIQKLFYKSNYSLYILHPSELPNIYVIYKDFLETFHLVFKFLVIANKELHLFNRVEARAVGNWCWSRLEQQNHQSQHLKNEMDLLKLEVVLMPGHILSQSFMGFWGNVHDCKVKS